MGKFNTHGGYFAPEGYFRINEGGSHEENPNGGVQVGVDQEGTPNVLEEGEPVYNDYVYSDNIYADGGVLEKYNIPAKYAGKLYSKIADAFVDEAEDRPNDPISNNGLNAMLIRLADAQEEQKAIAQQKELEEQLANMTPEELDVLEAMLAEQEAAEQQAAQEQVMQEQAMAEQQATPEEQAMAAQQMQAPVQEVPQQPMMAEGGKLYANGGKTNTDWPEWLKYIISPGLGLATDFVNKVRQTDKERKAYWDFKNTPEGRKLREDYIRTRDSLRQDYINSGNYFEPALLSTPDHKIGSEAERKYYEYLSKQKQAEKQFREDYSNAFKNSNKYAPGGLLIDPPTRTVITPQRDNTATVFTGTSTGLPYEEPVENRQPGLLEILGDTLDGKKTVTLSDGTEAPVVGGAGLLGWFNPAKWGKVVVGAAKGAAKGAKAAKAANDVKKTADVAKAGAKTVDKNKLLKEAYKRSAEAGKESGHFWTKDYWHRLPEHSIGEEIAANLLPGHNVWRHIRRANSLGKTGWNKVGRIGFALGEEGLRAKLGIGGYGLLRGPIASGVGDAYDYVSDNADYARNTVMPPAREVIDTGIDYSDHGDRDYALGGPMNKYLTGGPLEDLVKEYIQKTGNFPDPNQYAILQRLANLGTISNEDYASLNPKFANGLNPNKVRPAEEFGTVNKSISGRRIIPDVYNGGQLDSVVVRPRENDTIYNGGNLDSIFVRPAPDIYDGGNLDSIVVRPNVVPRVDTLLTSSAELNPITVSADKPSPEESYSSDYLWKNLGNGIGKKQRRVSKGIITVGGRPYDPVTRQFLDPKTYAGNGYYIPLSGNFRREKSVSATSTNSNTSSKRVDPLGAIAPIATPSGVVAENKKYGPEWWSTSAKKASENALNNKIDALPSDKRSLENTYNRVMANYNTAHQNDEALPTWMRYAGIANALGDMAWNLAQKPDRYHINPYRPVLPEGRMDLIDPIFNPLDENIAVNDLLASNAGTVYGLRNSGVGPSLGANLLAADYNAGRNIGAARTQIWDANNQRRNQIIAQRNQNAQALGQFRYGINRDRANYINQAALQNQHYNLLQQRLNNAAEQEKWNAFSQSKDAFAKGLANIGLENRRMNTANSMYDYIERPDGTRIYFPRTNANACGGTLLRKHKK